MVDEGASKAPGRKSVWVRVPPPAVAFWAACRSLCVHFAASAGRQPIDGQPAPRHTAAEEAKTELFPSAGGLMNEMPEMRAQACRRLPPGIAPASIVGVAALAGT